MPRETRIAIAAIIFFLPIACANGGDGCDGIGSRLVEYASKLCGKCKPKDTEEITIRVQQQSQPQQATAQTQTAAVAQQNAMATVATAPQQQFVAPSRSGAVVERSRSYGFGGGSLTLPSIKIGLPSFELPHLRRMQRRPTMQLEQTEAHMVSQASTRYSQAPNMQFSQVAVPAAAMFQQAAQQQRLVMPQQLQLRQQLAPAQGTAGKSDSQKRLANALDEVNSLKNSLQQRQKLLEEKLLQLDQLLTSAQPKQAAPPQPDAGFKMIEDVQRREMQPPIHFREMLQQRDPRSCD